MLKINDLTFSYSRKSRPVLEDFSLDLPAGGIYGLLGRNGAGKSTLLYLMCGLLTPQRGSVTYKDVNTRLRRPSTLADIFIVPEEFTLPAIPMDRYVALNAPFYPRFSREDLKRHLATFDLDPSLNLGALSMGQKKKAFMCFALACNTSLLLMDEPTNGLDIPGKSTFRRFIGSVINDERTIVISSHQVRDIDRILDHVIIMDNHSVLLNRSIAEISSQLSFCTTDDRSLIDLALYTAPSLGGAAIVLPNDGTDDTEVNLETLFDFALSRPDLLNAQFSQPANTTI